MVLQDYLNGDLKVRHLLFFAFNYVDWIGKERIFFGSDNTLSKLSVSSDSWKLIKDHNEKQR